MKKSEKIKMEIESLRSEYNAHNDAQLLRRINDLDREFSYYYQREQLVEKHKDTHRSYSLEMPSFESLSLTLVR